MNLKFLISCSYLKTSHFPTHKKKTKEERNEYPKENPGLNETESAYQHHLYPDHGGSQFQNTAHIIVVPYLLCTTSGINNSVRFLHTKRDALKQAYEGQ